MPSDSSKPLKSLSALGQSVWIDYLSRDSIRGGHLGELIDDYAVVGATSNPTIFQKAMAGGEAYDEQLGELIKDGANAEQCFWALAEQDIREACDRFAPVFDATAHRDGYVSIEVDPRLAYDTLATFREAMRLHETIDKPNLMVKIPATKPGLAAIEDAIAKGRSINITLIFSLQRYAEVAESYVRGLERLVAEGGDPSKVASVASFFVSRIDTEADRRLEEAGAPRGLQGKLAIANAKLAYQHYKAVFAGERWEYLLGKGATAQRVLWASTSTKNPDYADVLYVEELLGPDTVNTMPEETVKDYKDVTDTLEREGVEKFSDSFAELLGALVGKREALVAA
jgi:transaldolase